MADVLLDRELATFVQGGHSVLVATRSPALEPHATRACGIRVLPRDRVHVLLPRATSARCIEVLRDNGTIAVSIASPRDYRTVQLKGRSLEIADATVEDVVLMEEQLREFGDGVAQFRVSRKQVRNLWLFDDWRVTVQVTAAFAQTPGPGAGAPVERRRG